jgi:hypothetical protein
VINDNEIPLSLIDDFRHGHVNLFVGAGLSVNAGLPSWNELLESLGKRLFSANSEAYQFFTSCSNQEKAQHLYDSSDKITTINRIRDLFDRSLSEMDESLTHEKITTLPVENIITTNWDDLIEQAFKSKRLGFTSIWKDDQLSSALNGGINLIKLHGTLEDPGSIIFSEDDYNRTFHTNPLIKMFLTMLLSRSTVLMIGYSYQDDNFKIVYDLVKKQLGKNNKSIYALFLNENKQRLQYLKTRGLIPINFTDNDKGVAINNFLFALNDAVSILADNPTDRLRIVKRENGEIAQRNGALVLRNMSALGPLGTPDTTEHDNMFGDNTSLEIQCAKNWRIILDKPKSSAKLVLCLNDDKAKEVFDKDAYLSRIDALLNNIEKYKDKIQVVDTGNPLIMNNLDIYGNILFLENIKTNINNMGYGYLKVHKDRNTIKTSIDIFERTFSSILSLNMIEAKTLGIEDLDANVAVRKLVIQRLNNLKSKVLSEW